MSDQSPEDDKVQQVWQSQPTGGVRMSTQQLQAGAAQFQRRIQRRNLREYLASAAVVLFFAWEFRQGGDPLARTGAALLIAGTIYLAWNLHTKGSSRPLPGDPGSISFLEFQRRELVRQRDLLRSVWRWYLGPLVPGLAVLIFAFGRANPAHYPHMGLVVAVYVAVVAAVFFAIGLLNKNAARRLQRQIDELDEASR